MTYARLFKRTGECKRCGACCRGEITANHRAGDKLFPGVVPETTQQLVNALRSRGFAVVALRTFEKTHGPDTVRWEMVLRCANLKEDLSCAIFEDRPMFCRGYPNHFNTHHPECGYTWDEAGWSIDS